MVRQPVAGGFLFRGGWPPLGALLWLILGASGFLGYGARLLWAGPPRAARRQAFYDIVVSPGNRTVRRGANQAVTARLVGFESPSVRLFAKYRDSVEVGRSADGAAARAARPTSSCSRAFRRPSNTTPRRAGVRSKTFTLTVVDVPGVKRMRVTYRYPAWTGLAQMPSRIRAATCAPWKAPKPRSRWRRTGRWRAAHWFWKTGRQLTLRGRYGELAHGAGEDPEGRRVPRRRAGQGESVRLTDDYFIEAQKDTAPMVRIVRPGRDARVPPIEEVTVAVEPRTISACRS